MLEPLSLNDFKKVITHVRELKQCILQYNEARKTGLSSTTTTHEEMAARERLQQELDSTMKEIKRLA